MVAVHDQKIGLKWWFMIGATVWFEIVVHYRAADRFDGSSRSGLFSLSFSSFYLGYGLATVQFGGSSRSGYRLERQFTIRLWIGTSVHDRRLRISLKLVTYRFENVSS
ncbi:hypothetical protein C1645_810711 [Glomus cerebriforme]|uniref:Uncharacterized protein n=1 Tax=Glomus cerebriforme TaxID=658196 RepID=A0A397S162_9GLOM|nr:hypothetical protein C1645_810711 [Glomus cerebriforme]